MVDSSVDINLIHMVIVFKIGSYQLVRLEIDYLLGLISRIYQITL